MATELINGEDGKFNESALGFTQDATIAIVAIMGPQSSGKSTLLNDLFNTNFAVMNAEEGRSQTTKGIWIAKASDMDPVTMVLDLEGTDGEERGEDDKSFEKQSALFALAVADTVLINMWGNEIGRENAANRPLLKTIFEAMLSFSSQKSSQKTALIFVVRDKPLQSPPQLLEDKLKKDVHKIWEAVRKLKGHEHTDFTQIFDVKVTVLSNYEFRRADFDREVKNLKEQIVLSHQKGNNICRPTLSIFFKSAKETWDMVKKDKNLQVPHLRVMVATTRCEEIVSRQLTLLQSKGQPWPKLQQEAKIHLVEDFGKRASSILNDHLSNYDVEAMNLEESVTKKKRQFLVSETLKVFHPAYMHTLGHIRSKAQQSFKNQLGESGISFSESAVRECRNSCVIQFNKECSGFAAIEQANWEDYVSTVRQELLHQIKDRALSQLREQLSTSLAKKMSEVTDKPKDVWDCIRSTIKSESKSAESVAVDIFEVKKEEAGKIVADLQRHAENLVKTYFKDESPNVLTLMKHKFIIALINNSQQTEAYGQCLEVLSTMAVIRLDNNYDDVQRLLYSGLIDNDQISTKSLSSTTWEKVPLQNTLITPIGCRDIWRQFKEHVERNSVKTEEFQKMQRKKKEKGWSLPKWVIVGLLCLGTAGLLTLACHFLPAAKVLGAAALALAITAGKVVLQEGIYRVLHTNEIIEKDEALKVPMIKSILHDELDGIYASLIRA